MNRINLHLYLVNCLGHRLSGSILQLVPVGGVRLHRLPELFHAHHPDQVTKHALRQDLNIQRIVEDSHYDKWRDNESIR